MTPREELKQLQDKDYLGDGVYVGHDGYHLVLWLESTGAFGLNAIALEPGLLERLNRYVKRIKEKPQ